MARFSDLDLRAISEAIQEEDMALSESELAEILETSGIPLSREHGTLSGSALFNSLKATQEREGHRRRILAFLRVAMNPGRYQGRHELFDIRRRRLNNALALCGVTVGEDGTLSGSRAFPLSEHFGTKEAVIIILILIGIAAKFLKA